MSSRFKFHRLDALPTLPLRREIVEGLLAEGEIGAIVAPAGAGKSALAIALAGAVAAGTAFLGRTTLQGAVAYIAAERKLETERRFLATGHLASPVYVTGDKPRLAKGPDITGLVEALREIQSGGNCTIRLILIDTLAKVLLGIDENSAKEIGLALYGLQRLIDAFPSAAIVVLHHTGHSRHKARGSSALLGALDIELMIKSNGGRYLEVTKANAVEEGQRLPFRLRQIRCDDGSTVISACAAEGLSGSSTDRFSVGPETLPRDARLALQALNGMVGAGDLEVWRAATYVLYGDRKPSTKRQAFNHSKNRLTEDGFVTIVGHTVSVRNASENVSSDAGAKRQEERQKHSPTKGSSDASDAPGHCEGPPGSEEQVLTA